MDSGAEPFGCSFKWGLKDLINLDFDDPSLKHLYKDEGIKIVKRKRVGWLLHYLCKS